MSRHLHALPGGGGHPAQVRPGATVTITARRAPDTERTHPVFYDRATAEPETDPCAPTLLLAVSPLDASLLERACQMAYEREPSQAWVDLAGVVRAQRYGVVVDTDPTPAHGNPRPAGAS